MTVNKISLLLANCIILDEYNTEENIEKLSYGICAFLTTFMNIIVCAMSVSILGLLKEYVLFLIFFIPIRCNHKGFHCKSFFKCVILTNILLTIATLLCAYFSIYEVPNLLFLLILCLHYFASIERRKFFHTFILMIFLVIIFYDLKLSSYLIVSLLLNIILIEGGNIDEIISKKKSF